MIAIAFNFLSRSPWGPPLHFTPMNAIKSRRAPALFSPRESAKVLQWRHQGPIKESTNQLRTSIE
jgi:hypothetical protein